MKVEYKVIKGDRMLVVQLFGLTLDIDNQIMVQQTILDKDFIAAGNLIDRQTMPARLCYIIVKGFNQRVVKQIMKSVEFIDDEDLKNNLIEYTKKINRGEIETVPMHIFSNMIKEVQEYSESLNGK